MATVTGLTADKADEIHDQTLTGGSVDPSTGRLLFTTMGGAVIDAGLVRGSVPRKWNSSTAYTGGDLVFYAGRAYRAAVSNTNKVPGLDSSSWIFVAGAPANQWIETDPTFERSSFAEQWETFWKTGSTAPTVAYTTVAGEFDSGRRALKVHLPPSSSQRLYQKEENLVAGGEQVVLRVRAKKLAAGTGTTLNATLMQNDTTGAPEPLASGASYVSADVSNVAPTTSWATYEFRFTAVNSKPRGIVSLQVEQDGTSTSDVVIDSIRVYRGKQHEDSGWISVTPYSNFVGTLQYRRRNGELFLRIYGNLTAALSVGSDGNFSDVDLFDLPAGFRTSGGGLSVMQPFLLTAGDGGIRGRISTSGSVYLVSADARGVAYSIPTSTVIQGSTPGFLINS